VSDGRKSRAASRRRAKTNKWITRASRTLFKSRWIHLRQDDVRLPNGEDITYTWVEHGGYVVVVPILADGRVVMERVYRHTVKRTLLECPSGGLDGEDPITAGRRELEEETGYTARAWQHLGAFYGGVGTSNERFDVVVARDLREDGQVHREATEQIEVVRIPLAELRASALCGELEDAPSALAILLATERGES
jgi:ADP-ribose pyrophosphatase